MAKSTAKKALAQANRETQAEERRLKGTVKMYFVPVAFALGALMGFIAGLVR